MPNTRQFRTDVTVERLRELLDYDPASGVFTWRVRRGPAKPGAVAGSPHREGYTVIVIDQVTYLAHRLGVLYVTGKWPDGLIDHRDRKPGNGAFSNLRPATAAQNSINSTRADRGLPRGVFRHRNRFVAMTTRRDLPQRNVRIGSFETPEAAHAAWLAYMIEHHGPDFLPEEAR